ncbi:suppressor APC domain-containing protein 2 [Arapaima gigas]
MPTDNALGHFPESSQIRQNFLLSKLNEVSRCLGDLISWDGMSYESSDSWTWQTSPSPPGIPSAIQRLKDQNDQRIQEVTRLRERVRKLEQERCALIEQLYNAGAQNIYDCSTLDSTFI